MARPFDESLPFRHTGSAISSQTSLGTTRGWAPSVAGSYQSRITEDPDVQMNTGRGPTKAPKISSGFRLPKIKSQGTLRNASTHGRLHKRGSSASATTSPSSPNFNLTFNSTVQPLSAPPVQSFDPATVPFAKPEPKSRVKIRPLLRKFSSQEQIIDLSRSAAENEGLGIYAASDVNSRLPSRPNASQHSSTSQRDHHQRTTSATSQISTTSSNRYGQYVHPMRTSSHPYTPPIADSYKNSLDSDHSTIDPQLSHTVSEPIHTSYAPRPLNRRGVRPLHIRTGSASHLTSTSQTNLPGTPSSLRIHSDQVQSPSTMPTARSSMESSFRKRSRANTHEDPMSQAATVAALRQQFNEKEAAKDLKYQLAAEKAQEKEAKKLQKKQEEERRKHENKGKIRSNKNTMSEKSDFPSTAELATPAAMAYSDTTEVPINRQSRTRGDTAGSAGKAVQSQWQVFWFRFKTMWLKLKRKVTRSSK